MAQKLHWKNLATGFFFLAAITVLIAGLLIVGTNQNFFVQVFHLRTYLPDTQTLAEGTAVTLSGIEIGVIENIALDTHNGQNVVRFDLRLKKKYQPRITSSSRGIIKSIGVLGDKYLEITLGKAGEPMVKDGDEIDCEPAVDWERVARDLSTSLLASIDRVEVILGRIESGRGALAQFMADSTLVPRLVGALEKLDATLGAVQQKKGTLGRLVYDPALYDRLASTVGALDSVAARISQGHGTLGRLAADSTLYVHAAGAAAGLDSAVARLNAGRGSAGKALNDPAVYDELHRAVQDLRLLLIDMQKHPEKYVKFSVF